MRIPLSSSSWYCCRWRSSACIEGASPIWGDCINERELNCGFTGVFQCLNQAIPRLSASDTAERGSGNVFSAGIPAFKSRNECLNSGFTNLPECYPRLETDTGNFCWIFENSDERINRRDRFKSSEYSETGTPNFLFRFHPDLNVFLGKFCKLPFVNFLVECFGSMSELCSEWCFEGRSVFSSIYGK